MVNNILIEVLGAIAQNEREKTRRRQREGIDSMQVVNGKRVSAKTGNAIGRPSKIDNNQLQKILKKQKGGQMTVSECCLELGISRATWYNAVANM
jgi:DNA invertase Pin-like site-specific DNA recombinase